MAVVFRMPLVFVRKKQRQKRHEQKNKADYVAFIAAIETHYVHLDMFFSDWDFGNYPLFTTGKQATDSPGGPCAGTTSSSF